MKAEWHNYLIFKPKHITSLTLRKILNFFKTFASLLAVHEKELFFFLSDNTLERSRHPFCVFLLLFWVGNSGAYFFLISVWKIQAIFSNYWCKSFFCGCMRAKQVKRALTHLCILVHLMHSPLQILWEEWVQAFGATIIWLPWVPPTNHS